MRWCSKRALCGLAAAGAAAVMGSAAWAGCGPDNMQPANWSSGPVTADQLTRVTLGTPTIVGMWKVEFFDGVSGAKTDFGFAQWHADGTEIMNSAGHNPALQNYCMGVWNQTGAFTYHLTHYAEAYAPAGEPTPNGTLAATLRITEDVTVDPKNAAYSGHFAIDVVDSTTLNFVAHVQAGAVTAQRITP